MEMDRNSFPEDWELKSLKEVCEITTGKWDANHAVNGGKYRFYTCAFEHAYCDTNRFSGECLILPGNGANVGEVFYYNGEFDAYQRTYVIHRIAVDPKYLFYHLKLNWKKGTDAKQYGSATNYIRIGNFLDYKFQVPPLTEQKRIVAKIEELFSELDAGKQEIKKVAQQLKVYRQAVLKWAFEGRLTNEAVVDGELPDEWNSSSIGDTFEVYVGSTPSRKAANYWNGKIPWVSSGEVAFNTIKNTRERITQEGLDNSSCRVHPKGTVIMAMIGEGKTRGQAAILEIDAAHNQNTAAIVNKNNVYDSKLLYYYLVLKYEENRKIGSGNNQKALNKERVKNILIPLPPLDEQYRIVQEIEARLSVCDKIEETMEKSLLQAEALRQSILKKAFGGDLK